MVPVGHLAVNCGRSVGRVGYLAEGDLLLAPEVPRHLATGPLYDLGVGQVGRRSGVWEWRCWWSPFWPEGEMVFVALVVGFWVDVSGIRVGVMYGYADFINEVSGCGVMGLRGAKGCSAGKNVVLVVGDGK